MDIVTLAYTVGLLVFLFAIVGILLNKNNLIVILMCIELMLVAANINFISFSLLHDDITGQLVVFFVLAVAAAEAAIGLALIVHVYRMGRSISISTMGQLKG